MPWKRESPGANETDWENIGEQFTWIYKVMYTKKSWAYIIYHRYIDVAQTFQIPTHRHLVQCSAQANNKTSVKIPHCWSYVRGNLPRSPVMDSPHKWPITRKELTCHDVITNAYMYDALSVSHDNCLLVISRSICYLIVSDVKQIWSYVITHLVPSRTDLAPPSPPWPCTEYWGMTRSLLLIFMSLGDELRRWWL